MTKYKKIDDKDIQFLKSVVAPERVLVGSEIGDEYTHDEVGGTEGNPDVLVKVLSTEEVSKVMRYANENLIPVVPRGTGTGLTGASVAIHGGIMIETTLMNNILELDEENLMVTIEPGVLLMDLAKYVEERELFYPPDPGEKCATVAGNISTNAGGMRAVKYGVTRDYVRGLTLVLPTGDVIEVGGKVAKNSSGYAIKDLVVGSEGTLCIITKAVLRLLPLPKKSISLLVPFEDAHDAVNTVPKIIMTKVIPTAIELMQRNTIMFAENYLLKKFPDNKADAYLILTFDGNSNEQVESEYQTVADLCLKQGAIDVFIVDTDERMESVWSVRSAVFEAINASTPEQDECDVVVPRNRVADFIEYSEEVAKEVDIRVEANGHAGDGNLHIHPCRDDMDEETWHRKLNATFDLLFSKSVEIGGLPSGEHGIGVTKKKYLFEKCGDVQIKLMQDIKKAFDPNNILNPGKVCQ